MFDKSQTTLLEYPQGLAGSFSIPLGVTSIESNAFSDCDKLTSVSIPDSVTNIGESAFEGSGLTSINFGHGLATIGQDVFGGCNGLISLAIPNSVISLGTQAFVACANLASVTIPNSVTSVGSGAFDACYALTNVTLGNGVTNIGNAGFAFCFSLVGVYFEGNAPGVIASSFRSDTATVYYLPGTTGWAEFSTTTGLPVVLWNAEIQTSGPSFGVSNNQFGFNITGTTNIPIVMEASAALANPVWTPLAALNLTNGLFYFSEPIQTNSHDRFYRVSSP